MQTQGTVSWVSEKHPLTFPSPRAYNSPIPGMTENTFPFPGLSESARWVRARKDAKEIPPPDRRRPAPVIARSSSGLFEGARRFDGARKQTTRVEPRAMKAIHARPFIFT